MSEIDEPLPREHSACIVRASEVVMKIMDLQQKVDDLNLMGIAAGASTHAYRRAAVPAKGERQSLGQRRAQCGGRELAGVKGLLRTACEVCRLTVRPSCWPAAVQSGLAVWEHPLGAPTDGRYGLFQLGRRHWLDEGLTAVQVTFVWVVFLRSGQHICSLVPWIMRATATKKTPPCDSRPCWTASRSTAAYLRRGL